MSSWYGKIVFVYMSIIIFILCMYMYMYNELTVLHCIMYKLLQLITDTLVPRPLSFIEGVSFIEEFCSDLLYEPHLRAPPISNY